MEFPNHKSQIMSIWIYDHWFKQFLMAVIFGHFFSSYDQHHMLKDDEEKNWCKEEKLIHDC